MADTSPKLLRDLLDAGDIVMLTTIADGSVSSRPMTLAAVGDDHLEMLVSRDAEWLPSAAGAVVHVSLSDARKNTYAALNGMASFSRNPADIERLWSPGAAAFFDGKEDPDITVMRYSVSEGEYWDAPSGRIGALVSLVKAAVGGEDAAGDRGPIATT